jgi:hypothetical protein
MYFLAGVNKAKNFSSTVKGFQDMFFLQKLPHIFYDLTILGVVVLEIFAPIIIMFSLYTNTHTDCAYYSSVGLAVFTVLQYSAFMKNLTAIGSLMLLSTLFV